MIECEKIAMEIKDAIRTEIKNKNMCPTLAIIQVGDNQASNRYVKGKIKDCEEVGIKSILYKFENDIEQYQILKLINDLNNDYAIDGIIVQLPLPKHLNEYVITNMIDKSKDVDGFKSGSPFIPCTPKGVLTILDKLNVDLVGKNVTMVGYGKLVNKPLMNLLSDKGATVTVCRSHTPIEQLREYCKMSDIIVTAVGKNNTINHTCINKLNPPIIIDCGIDVIDGKQYGDCNVNLYDIVDNITPRIKGMGLLTRTSLLENVVKARNLNG